MSEVMSLRMEILFHLLSLFTLLLFYFFTMNSIHVICFFFPPWKNLCSPLTSFHLIRFKFFETKVLLYISHCLLLIHWRCYILPWRQEMDFCCLFQKWIHMSWLNKMVCFHYTNEIIIYYLSTSLFYLALDYFKKRLWRWFRNFGNF